MISLLCLKFSLFPTLPVKLKMDVLRESGVALVAAVRLLAGVEPHVGLQVARRAEPFPAVSARVRLLTWRVFSIGNNVKPCILYIGASRYIPNLKRLSCVKQGRGSFNWKF